MFISQQLDYVLILTWLKFLGEEQLKDAQTTLTGLKFTLMLKSCKCLRCSYKCVWT